VLTGQRDVNAGGGVITAETAMLQFLVAVPDAES
jgi:hypothetical protein